MNKTLLITGILSGIVIFVLLFFYFAGFPYFAQPAQQDGTTSLEQLKQENEKLTRQYNQVKKENSDLSSKLSHIDTLQEHYYGGATVGDTEFRYFPGGTIDVFMQNDATSTRIEDVAFYSPDSPPFFQKTTEGHIAHLTSQYGEICAMLSQQYFINTESATYLQTTALSPCDQEPTLDIAGTTNKSDVHRITLDISGTCDYDTKTEQCTASEGAINGLAIDGVLAYALNDEVTTACTSQLTDTDCSFNNTMFRVHGTSADLDEIYFSTNTIDEQLFAYNVNDKNIRTAQTDEIEVEPIGTEKIITE